MVVNATGGTINLQLKGTQAGVIAMTFSIIVVTQAGPHFELIVLTRRGLSPGAEPYLYANSSKFDFGGSSPAVATLHYFQWVTGESNTSSSSINYWAYAYLNTYSLSSNSNELRVSFWVGSRIYMTGCKIVILLVDSSALATESAESQDGSAASRYFSYNLGITTASFGKPSTGERCLTGLSKIDLYVYSSSSYSLSTQFLFTYSGQDISGLTYSYVYKCLAKTLCIGSCASDTYYSSSGCVLCSLTMPRCTACSTSSQCLNCSSGFVPSHDSSFCECETPRHHYNATTADCSGLCPSDCYRCRENGSCYLCNATADHRELSGERCVPLPGYYETNTTTAGACLSNCRSCSSPSDCSACQPRFFMAGSPLSCSPCPFDCWTCGSLGSCLSCNSSADHRQLQNSRCVPLPGYF